MDVQEALEYIYSFEKRGIHLDLGPVSKLLAKIGNPHRAYRAIHVAGTNGKGSVCAMIASMLQQAGYRTGLYTSPHLLDFRERIRVDGAMISGEELAGLVCGIRKHLSDDITFFEFATALAFLYFKFRSVDVAVIEVGMGGRLDATNCVVPDVALITNISVEHEYYLGRRLSQIAAEKGGIIKAESTCLVGTMRRSSLTVLESIAREKGARLLRAGIDFRVRRGDGDTLSYSGINRSLKKIPLPLAGRHQVRNAALALAAVEVLSIGGMMVDDRAIVEGMAGTQWEGRLEIVAKSPRVVLDGAHNPAGVSALCQSLRDEFTYSRLIVVLGVMTDKRYRTMLSKLASIAHTMILTEPGSQGDRTLHFSGTEDCFTKTGLSSIEMLKDPAEALKRARFLARDDDLVLVTGSLYLVGEIKRLELEV
ncbi:MAG: bifunctional folylpolyglutamate synthase/dihydrofolate synthase [Syntrophales bacterium]|nr:bifunctional folylpolyglutamate synthase/dihydrofolate synthase [Syntrophales bacterium]